MSLSSTSAESSDRAAIVVANLSYQTLEETYQSACFGADEPTALRASRKTRDDIIHLMIGMTRDKHAPHRFNSAEIMSDRNLPDGVIGFLGGRHPAYLFAKQWSIEVDALIQIGKKLYEEAAQPCP